MKIKRDKRTEREMLASRRTKINRCPRCDTYTPRAMEHCPKCSYGRIKGLGWYLPETKDIKNKCLP